jgi:tripartite-type tricarboxylate transporter receptor subunit TctC
MKKILLFAVLLISTTVFATPENDVIVTIGYGAGGTNTIIRTFAADADNVGILKFIPEERPGANGSIALKTYFNNTPTNKSILGVSGGQVLFEALVHPENNYINRLKFIGPVIASPLAVAVKADSKFKTLDSLFDKNIPAQRINIAVGGESHEMLVKQIAKYSHHDIQPIRYKGGSDQYTALMGGHVDMEVDAYGALKQKLPTIRVLGIAQSTSIDKVPSLTKYAPIPTMVNFFAIAVNKDTPNIQDITKAITVGFIKADRVDSYKENGYVIDLNPNSDYITREVIPTYKKWLKLLDKN